MPRTAKNPTKECIDVREAIGQYDVYQALRLSNSVFKELFGVGFPNSRDYFVGQQISQVVLDLSQSADDFSANFVMTNSTFALWELLCNNGFELKEANMMTILFDKFEL